MAFADQQTPKSSYTARQWLRGLLFPEAAVTGRPFGTGYALPVTNASEDPVEFLDRSHLQGTSGHMMSVRLRSRLSVGVYAVRRGGNSEHTRALGRTSFYDCLVALIYLYLRPECVVIFSYYATLMDLTDKAARAKDTPILEAEHYLAAARCIMMKLPLLLLTSGVLYTSVTASLTRLFSFMVTAVSGNREYLHSLLLFSHHAWQFAITSHTVGITRIPMSSTLPSYFESTKRRKYDDIVSASVCEGS
jgi:hypothetical protein